MRGKTKIPLIVTIVLIGLIGCGSKTDDTEPVTSQAAAEVTEREKDSEPIEEEEPVTEDVEEEEAEGDKSLDLDALESLKWVMEALVTLNVENDSYIHGLYSVEENAIITMLWYMDYCGVENPKGEDIRIGDDENGWDGYIRFTIEQVQEVMNSLTGQQVDLSSVVENGVIDVSPIGLIEIISECKNWSTEYIGNNTWKIHVDVYNVFDGRFGDDSSYKISEFTFIVTENPDSIFDGYSIIEAEEGAEEAKEVPQISSEWAKAYYDYLAGGDLAGDFYNEAEDYSICLCYIDEDNIPELYVYTDILTGYALYTYHDGKVVQLIQSNGTNFIEWIEKSGRVLYAQTQSAMYAESVWIYEMINGELQQIAEGTQITQDYIDWYLGELPPSTWNGQDVTEEEYQALKSEVFDTSKAVQLSYENDFLDLYSILDKLTSL